MGQLIGVVAQGGPAFVAALTDAWDHGDAVLPIDPRWPAPVLRRLVAGMGTGRVEVPPGPPPVIDVEDLELGGEAVSDGDALVVATSGSTGEPKGVVLTHAALAAHARAVHKRLDVARDDRWLACLPLAHIGGLGVVVRALVDSVGLEVHDRFDAAAVRAARAGGATLTSLVPTALDRVGADGFRWVVLGGSADPAASRPGNVVRTWGLTETGGGVVYDGRPLSGVEVAAIDGELWVRSPTLARGVRRADGSVRDLRRARPDDLSSTEWLPTDDGGSVSDDGAVTVHGRLRDMVVTGGENVWPDPVEAVLRTHAAVAEVAVVGRPDPEWGQRVEAWVVVEAGAPPPGLDALRDHVQAQLPAWCAPRAVHIVPELPRTASGKVRREVLVATP